MSRTVIRSRNIWEQLPPLLSAYRSSSAHTFESPVAFQLGTLLKELLGRVLRSVSGCPLTWTISFVSAGLFPGAQGPAAFTRNKDKPRGLPANSALWAFPSAVVPPSAGRAPGTFPRGGPGAPRSFVPLVELRGSAVTPWGGGEGSADTEPRLQRGPGDLSPDGSAGSGASGEHPGLARGTPERGETPRSQVKGGLGRSRAGQGRAGPPAPLCGLSAGKAAEGWAVGRTGGKIKIFIL